MKYAQANGLRGTVALTSMAGYVASQLWPAALAAAWTAGLSPSTVLVAVGSQSWPWFPHVCLQPWATAPNRHMPAGGEDVGGRGGGADGGDNGKSPASRRQRSTPAVSYVPELLAPRKSALLKRCRSLSELTPFMPDESGQEAQRFGVTQPQWNRIPQVA